VLEGYSNAQRSKQMGVAAFLEDETMNDASALSRQPLKLCTARVWRTYTGGKLIDEWHAYKNPSDSCFPEEWVSSLVTAYNPRAGSEAREGLSWLEHNGERLYLKDLIESDPVAFLGRQHVEPFGKVAGVLIKVLDSAERLAIQVHPDKAAAKRLFRSDYGKTEAWYIIGRRTIGSEPPYVLLGFKPGVTRRDWQRMFEAQDVPQMLDALHKIYVRPGDVYLVEGGVPHAIGPGCFLIEIQEPTDYTIRVERRTPGGLDLDDELCHQGLGFETMFDCFHYEGVDRLELMERYYVASPPPPEGSRDYRQTLIGPDRTQVFSMDRIEVASELNIDTEHSFSSLIVVSGRGRLCYEDGCLDLVQGDQLFVPNGVSGLVCQNSGDTAVVLVQCFPPSSA
jgi:mannose-6-phosphate isomerase